MSDTTSKPVFNEFTESCIEKYGVVPKLDRKIKQRNFITNGKIPTQGIEITAVFEAKDNPNIKIICAQNGVKINHHEIWGTATVVAIKKKFRRSMFEQVMTPDEIDVEMLLEKRDYLKQFQQELVTEIYNYAQELNFANCGVFPTTFC